MFGRSHLLPAIVAAAVMPCLAIAQEDAGDGGPAFKEGDVITFDQAEVLRAYLPKEFWAHRDFFLYEGMQLKIGPFFRDYSPADAYNDATARFEGQARLGPDGSLENYTAGQPFPTEKIDCSGDPQAGVKIMWNFDYQWTGDGDTAEFYYSYWDRGEELPLFFEGNSKRIALSHRPEPQYLDSQGGDIFRGEKR